MVGKDTGLTNAETLAVEAAQEAAVEAQEVAAEKSTPEGGTLRI